MRLLLLQPLATLLLLRQHLSDHIPLCNHIRMLPLGITLRPLLWFFLFFRSPSNYLRCARLIGLILLP